jgi:hypothetical protein
MTTFSLRKGTLNRAVSGMQGMTPESFIITMQQSSLCTEASLGYEKIKAIPIKARPIELIPVDCIHQRCFKKQYFQYADRIDPQSYCLLSLQFFFSQARFSNGATTQNRCA